jgi:hypothetical protein
MTRYLYVIAVQKTFSESELKSAKDEVCRLFDCTEVKVSGSTDFVVYTPLGPDEVEEAVRELSGRFGAEFRAGVKMD